MAGARAAIRYAKAVLDLAQTQNTAEAVHADMALIANTIAESKDLNSMLQSPVIRSAVKKATLLEVFKNTNTLSVNLIDTLIENKRIAILEDVALKYNQLYDQLKGTKVATVTTVVPLSADLESKVLDKVKALTGGNAVEINNVIDESIIGGFILRVGDLQYDASIANKLNKLKQEFTLN
ncbi:ATP synthase F1 subunit delta [Formosa sp. S-31]|uniref:ATP synthase F1 subunit delta n=1 Tax=Formosa sp. S-31 TaxID=2790949 RepID=UPI003EBF3964